MTIMVGETEIDSGDSATWEEGENEVTITVENATESVEYTVVVTKS